MINSWYASANYFYEEEMSKIKKPNLYKITLEDNDKLTIQYVKDVMYNIFKTSESVCEQNIMSLKKTGSVIIDTLPLQFAEQKQAEVSLLSKQEGIPFKCTIDKV